MKQLIKKLPLIKQFLSIRDDIQLMRAAVTAQLQVEKEFFTAQLLESPRYADPKRLNRYEAQAFSQNGEDGVIAEIFSRIGAQNRVFVEIGSGNGKENNSVYLLLKGWSGFWFDAEESNLQAIAKRYYNAIAQKHLVAARELFTVETAAQILKNYRVPLEFDLLSLDIDRNTSWVWHALDEFRPRVVVIEYNSSIPPQDDWEIPYEAEGVWDETLVFGAGLLTLQHIGEELGYSLVGCELSGTNAFFIRSDLALDAFSAPFTAAHHYEPPRYVLVRTWGHPRP